MTANQSLSVTNNQAHSSADCQCWRHIEHLDVRGVMLWSGSPVVAAKMAERLEVEPGPRGECLLDSSDWLDRLERFVSDLSPLEMDALSACEKPAEGNANPWKAMPVEQFLIRVKSDWFAELLNGEHLLSYFQPIIDVRQRKVTAFEALMRAEIDGNVMAAYPIIQAARAFDATFQLDRQAREAAIRKSHGQLLDGERLFINFMPTVIYDPNVCLKSTWNVAHEVQRDPSTLVFEVVEFEKFPEMDHLKSILNAYRDHGAHVALDDLGSGNTALNYIDMLMPDIIKFDRDLLPTEPTQSNLKLLQGLTEYAKGRGITVLIEGVETPAQWEAVQQIGADLCQGWLFGKPHPSTVRDIDFAALEHACSA